ncbi:tyrosine-type recombinase/integrase [Chloroflexota bacterium]
MKTYLEPHEVKALEEQAGNLRDRILIRLLFYLGCRISEVLGLGVEDVDLKGGTVIIQHLKTRLKLICLHCGTNVGKCHAFCPKCGGKIDQAAAREQEHRKTRTLPLDRDTLQMMKLYLQRGVPVKKGGKRLVFGVNRHRGWQIIHGCAEKAGLPRLLNPESGKLHGVSPHRLRDAFATHAVKRDSSGDSLRLLQEHLGHASFDTTARYRKVAGEEHKEWYEKLWENREGKKQDGTGP